MSFNSKYTGAQVEALLDNIKSYSANDILEKVKTVDGSGSGLDADLLDGLHSSSFVRQYGVFYNANEALNAGTYRFHETMTGLPDGATNYGTLFVAREDSADTLWQIYGNYNNDGLFYRRGNNTGISDNSWKQIAFIDSNVTSATKLQTARTIWGQSFDGTGNVSGGMTNVGRMYDIYSNSIYDCGEKWQAFGSGDKISVFQGNSIIFNIGSSEKMHISSTGNVGIGTANPLYKHHVVGDSYIQGVSYVANYISFDYKDHSINNESAGRLGTFDRRGGMVLQFGTNTNNRRFSIIDQQWTVELFSVDDSGNVFANGVFTTYSDQRKKTILNHVELSLKQIAEAPLIEHYYNSDEKKTTHVGSIAQYWASINDWFCKLDSEGFYTMEIQNAALASAISIARELDRYETKTDKDIKKLKERICELEEEVKRLKAS